MIKRTGHTAVITNIPFLLAIFLLVACRMQDTLPGDPSLPGSDLNGSTWTMTSMAGTEPLSGAEITAGFMNDQISGSTGCNNYFYGYRTEGERITLTGGGVTEMACLQPEGVMEQETIFLDLINQVQTFYLSETELRLITSGGQQLIFKVRP